MAARSIIRERERERGSIDRKDRLSAAAAAAVHANLGGKGTTLAVKPKTKTEFDDVHVEAHFLA